MHQALSANRASTMFDVCERLVQPRVVAVHTIPDSFRCSVNISSILEKRGHFLILFNFSFRRDQYDRLKSCLSSIMEECLTGTSLSALQDEVRELVQTVLYHCGSLIADNLSIDSLLMNILNCNKSMFQTSVQCWDEFRLRLLLNKFDKQLCV